MNTLRDWLLLMVDNTPDIIVVIDTQHCIQLANKAAQLLWGRSLIGEQWFEVWPMTTTEQVMAQVNQVWQSGQPVMFEEHQVEADGGVRWYQCRLAPIQVDEKMEAAIFIMNDITERHQAAEVQQGRNLVLQQLALGLPLRDILDLLINTAEAARPPMLCSVLLLDKEKKHLFGGGKSLPEFYNQAISGVAIGPSVGSCGTAAYIGQRVIVSDIMTHPYWAPYKELARSAGLYACWSEPILSSKQEVLGTFAMYYRQPREPRPEDLVFIETTAHLAGIAIEHAQVAQELMEYRHLLEHKVIERTEQWQQANQELERLNQDKDRFFSILAHDLKGPFMPLLGHAELLAEMGDNLPPAEVKQTGASIYRTAKNTFNLLENLLQWARLQMGRMEYNPQRLDVAEVAARTVELLAGNAAAKQVELRSSVELHTWVYTDENMLDTVIRNLTNNALKFTPKGGQVKIMSSLSSEGENPLDPPTPEYVEVAIVDTGVGMPPEVKEKLFQLDQHVTTVGTGKETGTGLGLIICQEMVVKSGGKIWVESEVGKGTTVKFTVRLDKV